MGNIMHRARRNGDQPIQHPMELRNDAQRRARRDADLMNFRAAREAREARDGRVPRGIVFADNDAGADDDEWREVRALADEINQVNVQHRNGAAPGMRRPGDELDRDEEILREFWNRRQRRMHQQEVDHIARNVGRPAFFPFPHGLNLHDILNPPDANGHFVRGRDPLYYINIPQDMRKPRACEFCKELVPSKDMLEHLDKCHIAMQDYKQKVIAVHRNKSGYETFFYALYKIREQLEIHYLEAHLDKSKLDEMECCLCTSFEDHMKGGCMENNQKEVFLMLANKVGMEILAHYEQKLEHEKQVEFDDKFSRYVSYFDSVDLAFGYQPPNLAAEHQRQAAWFEHMELTADETKEKQEFIVAATKKNTLDYEKRAADVRNSIESFAHNMCQYIAEKKAMPTLAQFLEKRKAHLMDNYEAPENEDDEMDTVE